MNKLKNLPQGVVLEAGTLVPPNDQNQQMGSFESQKKSSMCVSNRIGDNEERDNKSIILVGSDIIAIYLLNDSDYDSRSTLTIG